MEKLDFIDSKFRLSILAAKRAKQLVGGSKKKIDSDAENPLTIALEEIYDGKINFHIIEEGFMDEEDESLNFEESGDDSSFRLDDDNPGKFLFSKIDSESADEEDKTEDKTEDDAEEGEGEDKTQDDADAEDDAEEGGSVEEDKQEKAG